LNLKIIFILYQISFNSENEENDNFNKDYTIKTYKKNRKKDSPIENNLFIYENKSKNSLSKNNEVSNFFKDDSAFSSEKYLDFQISSLKENKKKEEGIPSSIPNINILNKNNFNTKNIINNTLDKNINYKFKNNHTENQVSFNSEESVNSKDNIEKINQKCFNKFVKIKKKVRNKSKKDSLNLKLSNKNMNRGDINNNHNNIMLNNQIIINENKIENFKEFILLEWKKNMMIQNSSFEIIKEGSVFKLENPANIKIISKEVNNLVKKNSNKLFFTVDEEEIINDKKNDFVDLLDKANNIKKIRSKSEDKVLTDKIILEKFEKKNEKKFSEKVIHDVKNSEKKILRKFLLNDTIEKNILQENNLPYNKYKDKEQDYLKKLNDDSLIYIVIDDNIHIRNSEKNLLNKFFKDWKKKNSNSKFNFNVIDGGDGIDALKFIIDPLLSKRIRGIFIDENMEYMNGSEAIKIIRKFQIVNKINKFNIASITAFEDSITKANIIQAGSDDIYIKPLSRNHLQDFFNKFPIK